MQKKQGEKSDENKYKMEEICEKKLDIFEYIQRATTELESSRDDYTKYAGRLCSFLEKALENDDEVVGVTYRIKTSPSLKEKIIRNNLYKKYDAENLVKQCSDIIGVRIECRFLQDEKLVYLALLKIFSEKSDEEYFCPSGKKNIFLKLATPQPEAQKNGHEIYRIDGYVTNGNKSETYKFELQIKSLVNSFWSEIEHKIIYKNKRFMMIDGFVNELMSSINTNLENIDKQLSMLFKRCLDNSQSTQKTAIENMLVSMINDLYSNIVEKRAGISVNIKPYSESLVKYILGYSSFKGDALGNNLHGGTVVNVIEWLKNVDFKKIPIGNEIKFSKPFEYSTILERAIGETLLASINSDFYCNTFFHILFSLEVGNDAQDFMTYVKYYAQRIGAGKTPEQQVRLKYEISKLDVGKMLLESEILRLSTIE